MKTIKEQLAEITGVYADLEQWNSEHGCHYVVGSNAFDSGEKYAFFLSMSLSIAGDTAQGCIKVDLPADMIQWADFDSLSELRCFRKAHLSNIFHTSLRINKTRLRIKMFVQATD